MERAAGVLETPAYGSFYLIMIPLCRIGSTLRIKRRCLTV
jgi:hypothetical protein